MAIATAALLAPAALVAQDASADSAGNWAAIEACARIDAAEERHTCMDSVIRRAGLLSDARVAQAARQEFGNENRTPAPRTPEPRSLPVAPDRPAAAVAAAPPAPVRAGDIDELTTTIASTRLGADRRLVIATAEGSVWEQVQSETFRTLPKAGDAFTIERTTLGGFRCRIERSTVFRCRRTD